MEITVAEHLRVTQFTQVVSPMVIRDDKPVSAPKLAKEHEIRDDNSLNGAISGSTVALYAF